MLNAPAVTGSPTEEQRRRALRGLRIYFAHRRWPRLMMSSVVLLSGGAGLLASFCMLHAGMNAMWQRYPLAVVAAWLAFLALMRVWVEIERRYFLSDDDLDALVKLPDPGEAETDTSESDWSWLDWVSIPDFEDAEGCAVAVGVAIVVVLLASAFVGIITVVAAAPALVAEVFLDAVLIGALYQRMKHIEQRWWLGGAIRQTWYPVLLTALGLMIIGFIMQVSVPGAKSIGEVWWHHRAREEQVERGS